MAASTPSADGFQMPAEFVKHCGTWMLWPQRTDNWRLGAKPAQKAFAAVASAISEFEPVTMCVNHLQYANARQMLPPAVRVVEMSSNDAWMRDCGPTFVINYRTGEVRGVDWKFNAWGNGLYFPWDLDDAVAQKVLEIERIPRYRAPFVLEGGSIHVDGEGTCLTTVECLCSPGRNPQLNQAQIEELLKQYLGVVKVLWVPRGVYNDETQGHIDNLACFIRPGEVALTWTDDTTDPQYERSLEALNYLNNQKDACGRPLVVHKVHQPNPVMITADEADGVDCVPGSQTRNAGDRLAGSYVNFYLCNRGAVVPTFGDKLHDDQALATLQALMPERRVVGIPAREILLGGGNIHCITQQQPMPHPRAQ